MIKQLVLDHTGHSTFEIDPSNTVSLDEAKKRFDDLTKKGYRAVALGKAGEPGTLMKAFDPTAAETLFIPQLQGG